jgi:hypothetical protein
VCSPIDPAAAPVAIRARVHAAVERAWVAAIAAGLLASVDGAGSAGATWRVFPRLAGAPARRGPNAGNHASL